MTSIPIFVFSCIFFTQNVVFLPCSGKMLSSSSSILEDPQLLESSSSSVMLTMSNTTEHILNQVNSLTFSTDSEKAFALKSALQSHSLLTQLPLQSFLTLAGVDFTPYWITNKIHIKEAFPELLTVLLNKFNVHISKISEEIVLPMMPTFNEVEGVEPTDDSVEWGVEMLGAPQAWKQGITGKGVIVGVLDTGCLTTHKMLNGKVVHWKDKVTGLGPHDLNGHGTHVCGTIAGKSGIGMAPDADLVVCKCCETHGCSESALLACGEYVSCPDTKCNFKPNVMSCSWGGEGEQLFFMDVINVWRSLNMFPVFALGNAGPKCNSSGSPGDYPNVCGVAAIDPTNNTPTFSSRGPAAISPTNNTKPQLTAPGVGINSCSHLSHSGYRKLSGTSMACPHISGMAALLLSEDKSLTYSELLAAMIASTSSVTPTGADCGGKSESLTPNYVSGFGKPNCKKAIAAARQIKRRKQQSISRKKRDTSNVNGNENNINIAEFSDFDPGEDEGVAKIVSVDFVTSEEEVENADESMEEDESV